MRRASERVVVKVADNGVGFDVAQVEAAHVGMGLRNMRERAHEIGATLEIRAVPGRGTQILLVLPTEDTRENGS